MDRTATSDWTWGTDLCAPFVALLPVSGASVSVLGRTGLQSTVCFSNALAAKLDELQFDLGEGPRWDVARTGMPVLCPDVRGEDHLDWPMFGPAMSGLDVGALFAFPILMGAVTVGVVDLYRTSPGALDDSEVSAARMLARTVARPAVQAAFRSAGDAASTDARGSPGIRREVQQAIGMILIQLETTATEAFALLRARAFADGRSVDDVAQDVVARRLDFRHLPD